MTHNIQGWVRLNAQPIHGWWSSVSCDSSRDETEGDVKTSGITNGDLSYGVEIYGAITYGDVSSLYRIQFHDHYEFVCLENLLVCKSWGSFLNAATAKTCFSSSKRFLNDILPWNNFAIANKFCRFDKFLACTASLHQGPTIMCTTSSVGSSPCPPWWGSFKQQVTNILYLEVK